MLDQQLNESKRKMEQSLEAARQELGRIRTGRANPSILDKVIVEAYGQQMPLIQVASLAVPDPHTIVIKPFDKSQLANIEKGISKSDVGLPPNSDGNIIRLHIPPLTKERREKLVKLAKTQIENGKVSIRNLRRDANDFIKEMEKNKDVSEDQMKDGLDRVQKLTDEYIKKMDELIKKKEEEILQ
ncbi:ribosome recycling factor [bacterium]|nr:ribosome recycling factor [bacterium]